MKRLIPLVAILSALSMQAAAQNEFTIEGHLKNTEDGTVIGLWKQNSSNFSNLVQRDTVKNGRFYFKYNAEDTIHRFSISSSSKGFPSNDLHIWVKAGSAIEVYGNDNYIYTWDIKSDIPQQTEQKDYIDLNRQKWIEIQRLDIEKTNLHKNLNKLSIDEQMKSWITIDSITTLFHNLLLEIYQKEMEHMSNGAVTNIGLQRLSSIAFYIFRSDDNSIRPYAQTLYDNLNSGQKNSDNGKFIYEYLYPSDNDGSQEQIADTELYDLEGRKYKLSDFKGKYILVDFWSIGCGPCIMAMPETRYLAEKHKDILTIISICSDTEETWKKFSPSHNMTWHNFRETSPDNGLANRYNVEAFPRYIIVSPEGSIIDDWTGYGYDLLRIKIMQHIK